MKKLIKNRFVLIEIPFIKSLLVFFILLCIGGSVAAQTEKSTDGGATEILNAMSKKYAAYTSMQIDYTFKQEKDTKIVESFKGQLLVKGNSYQTSFNGQQFFCDGTTIWNYQTATNEVSIFDYDKDDEMSINPAKLLANWKKTYKPKFIRDEFFDGKMQSIIDLTPIKTQVFYKIRLYLNKETKEMTRLMIYQKDNIVFSYYVNKIVPNKPIADTQFQFNEATHPKVKVNDMR